MITYFHASRQRFLQVVAVAVVVVRHKPFSGSFMPSLPQTQSLTTRSVLLLLLLFQGLLLRYPSIHPSIYPSIHPSIHYLLLVVQVVKRLQVAMNDVGVFVRVLASLIFLENEFDDNLLDYYLYYSIMVSKS